MTDLDLTLIYISILGTYCRFVRKNKMLALGVYFSQPCSIVRFSASRSRLDYYQKTGSFPQTNSMKCFVKWILLNVNVYSNQAQPYLNLEMSRNVRHVDWSIRKETHELLRQICGQSPKWGSKCWNQFALETNKELTRRSKHRLRLTVLLMTCWTVCIQTLPHTGRCCGAFNTIGIVYHSVTQVQKKEAE